MTDEKARDNFLKYGNPDGRGSMAVGIALPQFLQKQEHQLTVLIIFFIIIIIVIPYYFLTAILGNEKDIGGVQIDNRKIFTELINENMIGKQLPGILSHSAEFSAMRVRNKEELDILKRLREKDEVREAIPKPKGDKQVVQIKPICLLMGYMYNLIKAEDYE